MNPLQTWFFKLGLKNSFLQGRSFSAPVKGMAKFLAANGEIPRLGPWALKDRDCVELPVQKDGPFA